MEKRQWNAKMNAKGLDSSVSEEQAKEMCLHQGSTHVFIVQAHAGPKTVNEDGSEVVNLIPDLVELVPEEHAERIRTFQRALYVARPEQYGQEPFEGGDDEPKVGDAAADLDALVERDDDGEPVGIWDGSIDEPTVAAGEDSTIGGHVMACHAQRSNLDWVCSCPESESNVAPLFKDA